MRRRGITVRSGVVGVGGVLLLTFLTACGGDPSAGSADRLSPPGAAAAPVTPVTPSSGSGTGGNAPTVGAEGAVGRVVLMAYQSWWDAQTSAFGRSDSDGTQLQAFSTGLALSGALASLHQLHEAKLVMIGAPRNAPVVKTLNLSTDPQTSVIEDCLDVTDWHQADSVTKALRDPEQRLTRYIATVSLRKSDGQWMIVDFKREVGRTC